MWRHRLQYIEQVGLDLPSVNMDFGTAIHAACEHFLRTKVIDKRIFLDKLKELWSEHADKVPDDYTAVAFKQFGKEGLAILPEVPGWLDETFPGWEFIDAEHLLYEPIVGQPHAFKGYIDGVIRAPSVKVRQKWVYWLLDWKGCGWGWHPKKKSDPLVKAQLILYKNYWAAKTRTDPDDVKCGFVLLKRTAKAGDHCELVRVSTTDLMMGRSLKMVTNMVVSVKRGMAIKNRASCTFCEYFNTPHCT